MKAILTAHNLASSLVTTIWTPLFAGIFLAIVVAVLWPRKGQDFDRAARMPLREE